MVKILGGDLKDFPDLIVNNIDIGLLDKQPIPYLSYNGSYYIESTGNTPKIQIGELTEIIEEVIFSTTIELRPSGKSSYYPHNIEERCLITRESGSSDPKKWTSNTRVSLLRVKNNSIYLWSPTLEEIFLAFRKNFKPEHLSTIKLINNQLGVSTDFSVSRFINYNNLDFFAVDVDSLNEWISLKTYFSLIKHILISEDIRYPKGSHFGRNYTVTALIDFINNKLDFETIKERYQLHD
ncbi:MAG: hypothetical protein K0R93_686 [Anaerosolibacter sp.]|jgi:hypothetical protein|uniref:hypothetical protein n=1 Tax=Anaerosolibacter sp. TaxID=1872527 RepID=UPI00261DC4DE|nr:hypothetical protein [Anaerosolibacter sp.]MDF2545788.1 hypothetical protein [Anaerosolibacter sp.]